MVRSWLTSLRFRLLIVLALVLLPAISLSLYSVIELRHQAKRDAEEEALWLAQLASSEQERWISATGALLLTVAHIPEVHSGDALACGRVLTDLLDAYPSYTAFAVATPSGEPVCAAGPGGPLIDGGAFPWFQRAVETRQFTVGGYEIDRLSGRPAVRFAQPHLEEDGSIQQVIVAELDLAWLAGVASKAHLPPGSTLTITDGRGVVLARTPDGEQWVGKAMPPNHVVHALLSQEGEDAVEAQGLDGETRLYGLTTIGGLSADEKLRVAVGIPLDVAYGAANREMRRNLIAIGLATVLLVGVAWLGTEVLALRSVRALAGAACKLGRGDLSARAGPPYDRGEMGQLARTFDDMASALSLRDAERAHLLAAAHDANRRLETARQFLAGAGELLAGSLDYEVTLDNVAGLVVPGFADYCFVDIIEEGRARRVAIAHANPAKAHLLQPYRDFPPDLSRGVGVSAVLRTGTPLLEKEVTDGRNVAVAQSAEHLAVIRALDPRSCIIAPLIARGQTLGAITLVTSDSGRRYTEEDLALAEELAQRCATAVDNARLFQQAQRERRALQVLLDSMTEGVLAVDQALRIERVNEFARRTLGLREGEIIARPLSDVLRLTDEGQRPYDLTASVYAVLNSGQLQHVEERWLALPKGKRMPVSLAIAPGHDGSSGAVVLFRDVTHWREVDELRQSFISLVSHELRTPLHHIKGFASTLLQSDVEWDEEMQMDFIRTIDQEADRLAKLVDDLLEMSRLESGRSLLRKENLAPHTLVERGVWRAGPFLRGRSLGIDTPDNLPFVSVDAERVERVLVNLLENAAKYSPTEGRIDVAARADGVQVVFSVRDRGPGVPEEARERVFEKFTRLETSETASTPGTGLGLAICKAIVQEHGGRIWVENARDGGAVFQFTLPIASPALAGVLSGRASKSDARRGSVHDQLSPEQVQSETSR